uniref:Uncharacterized protein n=1 Tax=Acrobeloides nanus TaxID=290746 RepID=A0A914CMN1_9BILA
MLMKNDMLLLCVFCIFSIIDISYAARLDLGGSDWTFRSALPPPSSCPNEYNNTDIQGNDLVAFDGQFSDCCGFCERTAGCKSYSY